MKNLEYLILLYSILIYSKSIAQVDKPNDTLPVEMVYFIGDVVDSAVEIKWGTATEVNNYGYDVLRTDSSFNWEKIDFVQGHGNSYSPKDYIFTDTTITANGYYFYQLKQIDFDGNFELTHDTVKVNVGYVTSIKEESYKHSISTFSLAQNYPNPFNPETNIVFTISESNFVTLKLFTLRGEEVATIFNENVTAGTHTIKFKPNSLSSGTYIYKLNVKNNSISKKMLLMK